MLKQKKFTTQQRLGRLERVVSQNWAMNKNIQTELKSIQEQLNKINGTDEDE